MAAAKNRVVVAGGREDSKTVVSQVHSCVDES
jgi:hypothetical protein